MAFLVYTIFQKKYCVLIYFICFLVVCKLYSEQRAIRVKRVVDKKRM